ncbi:uncharacterized protein LOC103976239 [Musa acuminata AAA Group]|uniref:uncharacterized protein LOC103976239 n=1 Tax=Musa acuminata AAA Group TaxID=214697 RepID=UPI0031D522C5
MSSPRIADDSEGLITREDVEKAVTERLDGGSGRRREEDEGQGAGGEGQEGSSSEDLTLMSRHALELAHELPTHRSFIRMLREELQLLQEPGSYVGEVVKVMGKSKVLVKVIELPIKYPELFESLGIAQPKGVLLYGPPGTGKTLLARVVAHHTDCTFIRVSGSALVQKYIGEGSRMVRELFVMARLCAQKLGCLHSGKGEFMELEDFETAVAKVMKKETEKNMSKLWK